MSLSVHRPLNARRTLHVLVCVCAQVAVAVGQQADVSVDFNSDILPILSSKCFACHGPDAGERLTAGEIALLRRWIVQGARWKPQWAFVAPHRSHVPGMAPHTGGHNPGQASFLGFA